MKIELTGLPMILFIVFLVLRLCKVIAWSWWWVTSPLWIMVLFVIGVMILYFIIAVLMELRKYRKRR